VVSPSASWGMTSAFVFGQRVPHGPVSDLRLFGRAQDLALQKAREVVAERNHLRLWLAPVTWRGQPVVVGQISRDVGIKLSGRLWPPTTHEVDPDVDAARFQLMQDMLASERVARLGFGPGVGAAPRDAPRHNAEHDPYFTDGLRAIFVLAETRTDVTAVRLFGERYPIPTP
jgi:LssY C-terminus